MAPMFFRNLWLKIPLLFAVVGHAQLFESLTHRAPPGWQIGLVLTIGAVVLPLLGEWIAEDASSLNWRRMGWRVAAFGAGVHLLLDTACLALPWVGGAEWKAGLAGALVGAVIMLVLLRGYLGALRDPEGLPPPAWMPTGDSLPARLWREAHHMGGTAILVMLIGWAFVAVAAVVLLRRPAARDDMKLWLGLLFFAGCTVAGLGMGLERRAMVLGLPAPLASLRPRWLRRATFVATREGLLFVDRRGATLYRWNQVAAVSPGTLFNNAALFVDLIEEAAPERVRGDDEARALAQERKARAFNRGVHGVDLTIMSMFTEHGPGPLERQLREALADPATQECLPRVEEEIRRIRRA